MLLTGFQGYGGRSDNPSAQVVEALDGTSIKGVLIRGAVLPVTNHDLRERIESLIVRHQPELVICLGLAPGENMIRLERLAANYSNFEIPDNAGERYRGPIRVSAPAAYDTGLPVDSIQAALLAQGLPARISASAGTFLCNAIMYHALHYCHQQSAGIRAGFIHLPYLPAQVSDIISQTASAGGVELHQRSDLASMALEQQIAAITIAIETCVP